MSSSRDFPFSFATGTREFFGSPDSYNVAVRCAFPTRSDHSTEQQMGSGRWRRSRQASGLGGCRGTGGPLYWEPLHRNFLSGPHPDSSPHAWCRRSGVDILQNLHGRGYPHGHIQRGYDHCRALAGRRSTGGPLPGPRGGGTLLALLHSAQCGGGMVERLAYSLLGGTGCTPPGWDVIVFCKGVKSVTMACAWSYHMVL